MAIERTDSQQTTCNAIIVVDGERKQAASATCSIRPGRSMTFSVDLSAGVELSADDWSDIRALFIEYLDSETEKAEKLGIPI